METPRISRISFDKLIPFYVVEQSNRSCVCATCYKARLSTTALHDLWKTLHRGSSPGTDCTCTCELCENGGCIEYLPYDSRKEISSMGKFSDMHMCDQNSLYTSRDGTRVKAHTFACVSGHCAECERRQSIFFDCPRHKGGLQRQLYARSPTTGGSDGTPPGEITWNMFTDVDENGQATTETRNRNRQQRESEDMDADFDPRGGSKHQNRQVGPTRGERC